VSFIWNGFRGTRSGTLSTRMPAIFGRMTPSAGGRSFRVRANDDRAILLSSEFPAPRGLRAGPDFSIRVRRRYYLYPSYVQLSQIWNCLLPTDGEVNRPSLNCPIVYFQITFWIARAWGGMKEGPERLVAVVWGQSPGSASGTSLGGLPMRGKPSYSFSPPLVVVLSAVAGRV